MPVAQFLHNNRLLDAVQYYMKEEQALYVSRDNIGIVSHKNDILKIQFYEQLLAKFKTKLNKEEKATRFFIQNEIKKIKFRTDKSFPSFLLNNSVSRWLSLFVNEQLDQFKAIDTAVKQYSKNAAIESSMVSLNKQLQQSGFSKNIESQLRRMMDLDLDKFHLHYFDLRHPDTDYVLHFSKVPGTNNYRFHDFEAAAVPNWMSPGSKAEYTRFTFDRDTTLTATQASNLLYGGAIANEYNNNHWTVLDKTDPANPLKVVLFDLEAALKDFPLPPMDDMERSQLLQVLRAGGGKELNYEIDNAATVYKLQASPINNSVVLTDHLNRYVNPASINVKAPSIAQTIALNQSHSLQNAYTPRLTRV